MKRELTKRELYFIWALICALGLITLLPAFGTFAGIIGWW
jgi:hypothetical protein